MSLATGSCGLVTGDAFDVTLAKDAGVTNSQDGALDRDVREDASGGDKDVREAASEGGKDVREGASESGKDVREAASDGDDEGTDSGFSIGLAQSSSCLTPSTMLAFDCAFNGGAAAGDTVIVAIQADQAIMSMGVADGVDPPYALAVSGGSGTALSVYYMTNVAAGVQTITIEFQVPANAVVLIHEFSGLPPNATRDRYGAKSGTGTMVETIAITPSVPDELIFAYARANSGLSMDAGAGFMAGTFALGNLSEYRTVDKIASYQASFTALEASDWTAVIASFGVVGD
jgi:hypothetical protein